MQYLTGKNILPITTVFPAFKTEMLEWGSPGPGGVKVHASVAPRLICHCAAVKITGSPGSMLAVRIDSNLRQRIRIYEICSKCDIFEKYK